MGIFDKFFKNKKIIDDTVQKAIDGEEIKEKDEAFKPGKSTEENTASEVVDENANTADKIRIAAKQYLPGDVLSVYAQREMIKTLVNNIDIPEKAASDAEAVLEKLKKGEMTPLQSSAVVANNVNTLLNGADCELILQKLSPNENDSLLKTWVVLDYYISTVKREFSENLRLVRDALSKEITCQGLDEENIDEVSEIMKLEKECHELQKDKEKANELKEKRTQLVKLVLMKKALYVLFDEDFNSGFPYVSFDGRIEVCTRFETAGALKKHYEKIGVGHTTVRRLENKEYTKLFKAMVHMGIAFARFDNGTFPADVVIGELAGGVAIANVIERFNSGMRGLFLRNLQYSHRINKAADIIKGTPSEKSMLESMLTCRFNGYREFGNSLIYVFANPPYEKGITLYTANALDKAKKLCTAVKLDEKSLVAPGDAEVKVYEGGMNFRVTHKSGDDSMENSYICVFTSRLEAEKARLHFEKFGVNDSVVAVTFEELAGQVSGCAGALIDMSSYGLEIKKKEFEEIKKWKNVKGRIAVNLKKKEDAEQPGTLDDENKTEN